MSAAMTIIDLHDTIPSEIFHVVYDKTAATYRTVTLMKKNKKIKN